MMENKQTITWSDVLAVHKKQQAVNFVGSQIVSIICSPSQNKLVSENKIIYSIPNRKQYLNLIANMKTCIATNGPIRIFVKKDKNIWEDAGFFKLIASDDFLEQIDFVLQK